MHGPPGCGKSSIISLLVRSLLKDNGLIVKFPRNTNLFKACMRGLRNIQPNLPVIVLMEDLNYILDDCDESDILNLLDGIENFSHNTVYLGTTNYFSQLPGNIRNRPSRFDLVVEVGPPAANIRKQYFESLLLDGDKIDDLDKWVENSEGLSFAHLEELFKSVFLFDNSFDNTLARIRSMGADLDNEGEE
jgi:DNA polymerase III delta prime subunit